MNSLPVPSITGVDMGQRITDMLANHTRPQLQVLQYLRCPAIHEYVLLELTSTRDEYAAEIAALHDAIWRCDDVAVSVALRSLATVLAYISPDTHSTVETILGAGNITTTASMPASYIAVSASLPPDVITVGLALNTQQIHADAAALTIVDPSAIARIHHPSHHSERNAS